MRIAISLAIVLVCVACGDDDKSTTAPAAGTGAAGTGAPSGDTVWQCGCTQLCDGTEYMIDEGIAAVCTDATVAEAAVDVATAVCAEDGEATCTEYTCECQCEDQGTACTP